VIALWRAIEQIVGRERRERVSQLARCGEGCFDSRRRVNSTVMRGNSIVMKFLASICWVMIVAGATLASDPPRKLIETRSYPTGWEADMGALDLLSNALQNEPGTTGIIFVYGANRELATNVQRRIRCFETYMTNRRGVPSNRIRVLHGGYRQHATIELWVVASGAEAPTPKPTLGREDVRPAKHGTRYRCDN
jgi:hypothetical protein